MKASRIITFILGIVMIVTGIYCLFTPVMTYMTFGYIVGFNMVADAIGGIVTWSSRKKEGEADGWTLAGAIISLLFGAVLLGSTAMQLAVDAVDLPHGAGIALIASSSTVSLVILVGAGDKEGHCCGDAVFFHCAKVICQIMEL